MKKTAVTRLTLVCVGLVFTSFLVLASRSDAKLDMTGVVAIWLFDEGQGKKVSDASGKGNDGEFKSGEPKWVDGVFGTALSFDGQDDWVEMNAPVVVDTVDLAMGCWVNPGETQKRDTNILSSHQDGPSRGISFEQQQENTNRYQFIVGVGGGYISMTSTQLKANVWQHFVCVRKGNKATHYLDGKSTEYDVQDAPAVAATAKFRIGSWVNGGREFNGILDEAFILKRALSQAEVTDIMNSGIMGPTLVSPGEKIATAWGKIKTQY